MNAIEICDLMDFSGLSHYVTFLTMSNYGICLVKYSTNNSLCLIEAPRAQAE